MKEEEKATTTKSERIAKKKKTKSYAIGIGLPYYIFLLEGEKKKNTLFRNTTNRMELFFGKIHEVCA